MRLLLDTHTFIWFFRGDSKLSATAKLLIENMDNEVLLSKASAWEIAIKQGVGKLNFGLPFKDILVEKLYENRVEMLDISLDHIEILASLPLHHRDPFDRLIIAQGIVENIPIVSADAMFDTYPIQRIW
jgi:PIN domain nuclease of toxin-antitoxin system